MSLFLDLQTMAAQRLMAIFADEPGLGDLQILTEAKGDIATSIKLQLQKIGFGVTVLTPAWKSAGEPNKLEVDLSVVVTERVVWNQSAQGRRRTATEVGELVYCALQEWRPRVLAGEADLEDVAVWTPLRFVDWSPRETVEEAQAVIWAAVFRTTTMPQVTQTGD